LCWKEEVKGGTSVRYYSQPDRGGKKGELGIKGFHAKGQREKERERGENKKGVY